MEVTTIKHTIPFFEGIDDMVQDLISSGEQIIKNAKILEKVSKGATPSSAWHPACEVPSDDNYYIVKTAEGKCFVSSPISGKWMDFVNQWMYIPE